MLRNKYSPKIDSANEQKINFLNNGNKPILLRIGVA
jgi:hypothetical protein